jgi:hypothetical protein
MTPTKEERIKRRRDIIQRRREGSLRKEFDQENDKHEIASCNLFQSEQQVVESLSQLERCMENQIQDVTAIQIKLGREESAIRAKNELNQSEILKQVESNDDNDDNEEHLVETIWDEIQAFFPNTDVRETHDALENAKMKFEHLLHEKDGMIDILSDGLKEQDLVFLETVKNQEITADSMRALVDNQMLSIQRLSRYELRSVEEMFEKDRGTLLEEHSSEIRSLVQKKRLEEIASLNAMQKRVDEKTENAAKTHDEVTEEYNSLQNKLQEQVSQLERDWSLSRGLYALSSDQIEYDHRELDTRNTENEIRIKKSRKRIVQIKGDLKKELEQARSSEEKDKRKNGGLEVDCQRLEGQFQNLVTKLYRFDHLQEQTFSAALAMHKEEAGIWSRKIQDTQDAVEEVFYDR